MLLRALQEREIERLGGTRSIPINVRLIAATNRDTWPKWWPKKTFRSDLFYRLKVFPSRRRRFASASPIFHVLVRHFVDRHSRRMGKTIETIPPEAMNALIAWKWPGNIRELENFLERAVILTRGTVLHVPLGELESIDEAREMDEAAESNPHIACRASSTISCAHCATPRASSADRAARPSGWV